MIASHHFMTWHRRLSLIAAVALFFWALSGVSHPIMTYLQPTPINKMPPHIMQMGRRDVSTLLPHIQDANDVRLVGIRDQLWWRREQNGQTNYLHFDSFQINEQAEAQHAEFLARFYTGETKAKVARVELIKEFSDDYPWVNRMLPVWAVQFERDDGLTAYVDTRSEKLSLLSDHTKHGFSTFFRFAHNFRFLDSWPTLRLTVMLLLITITVFAAIMGLILWWRLRHNATQRLHHKPWRRWHRHGGLLLSWALLAFALSAFWHVIHNAELREQTSRVASASPITQQGSLWLPDHSSNQMQLLQFENQLWWRIPPMKMPKPITGGDHHHGPQVINTALLALWNDPESGAFVDDVEDRYRQHLVTQFSEQPVTAFNTITAFAGEYGFVNKRLPVYQATLADGQRLYIDPSTRTLAAQISDWDASEGYVFHYLHKWNWLPGGKTWRDLISGFVSLAIAILSVVGIVVYAKKSR